MDKSKNQMLAEIFAENPMPYPYFVGNVAPQIMEQDFDGRVDILEIKILTFFQWHNAYL